MTDFNDCFSSAFEQYAQNSGSEHDTVHYGHAILPGEYHFRTENTISDTENVEPRKFIISNLTVQSLFKCFGTLSVSRQTK